MLGEGGMGSVWEAAHEDTGAVAALKLLKEDHADDAIRRRRLLREARAASAVVHPNVVAMREVFEAGDGSPVVVMDLLTGETLGQRLAREGTLPLETACALLAPVVSAVATAHAAGVVHRDLKPDNVFLATETGMRVVVPKVLDFGIAKVPLVAGDGAAGEGGPGGDAGHAAGARGLTTTGAVLGTPHYMAPEQLFGEGDVDHRADVWSLGVMIYECLTGMRPLGEGNLGHLLRAMMSGAIEPIEHKAPWLPASLSTTVRAMLSRERAARPDLRDVHAVLVEQAGALSTTLAVARPVEPPASPPQIFDGDTVSDDRFRTPRGFGGVVPALPRPPGESRFNIKGSAYRGLARFVGEHLPGGLDAFCAALGDPALAAFARQPFVAQGRYDILPIFPMFAAAARLLGTPFDAFVRTATTAQCDYDARSTFKHLYEGARPEDMAARITAHGAWYYDFGRTIGTMPEPDTIAIVYYGQPAYLEPWFTQMHLAYTEESLRIVGATEIVGTQSHVAPGGSRHGLALVDVRTTVRWRIAG